MSDYLIGVDFHCKYQRVAWLNRRSGETQAADLRHDDREEVVRFYRQFPAGSVVGLEAGGYSWWFEQLLEQLRLEVRVGHPGHIARMRLRRQRNDRRDAQHVLELLVRGEFPEVWRGSLEQRARKKVIRYRVQLVRERTRWINRLRALGYNFQLVLPRGYLSRAARRRLRELAMGGELEGLRDEMLERIEVLQTRVRQLDRQIQEWARQDPQARRVMTIPGLGPITSLYLVLTLGPPSRFPRLKQVVGYVGLDSMERSSDNLFQPRRYGSISKQGDRTLRWLLTQGAVSACRHNPRLRRFYRRLLHRKGMPVARIAAARKLLVWAFVLLRDRIEYPEFSRRSPGRSVRGLPENVHGPRVTVH